MSEYRERIAIVRKQDGDRILHMVDCTYEDSLHHERLTTRCGIFLGNKEVQNIIDFEVLGQIPRSHQHLQECQRCWNMKGPRKGGNVAEAITYHMREVLSQLQAGVQRERAQWAQVQPNRGEGGRWQIDEVKKSGRLFHVKLLGQFHPYVGAMIKEIPQAWHAKAQGLMRQEMEVGMSSGIIDYIRKVTGGYMVQAGLIFVIDDDPFGADQAVLKGLKARKDPLVGFLRFTARLAIQAQILTELLEILAGRYIVEDSQLAPLVPVWRAWARLGTMDWVKPFLAELTIPSKTFTITRKPPEEYGHG